MTPFLKQVAGHYFDGGGISRLCFVLPNRRSCVFLKKYLGECAAARRMPVISPAVVTIDEFILACAGARPCDQVTLLLELYGCYKALNPQCEALDDFIFWGGVLLSDFDDVDKYLADPEKIFTNISDFRGLQDSLDYLDERQKAALERFFRHFHGEGKYKEAFRSIWNLLLPLYDSFNAALDVKGLCYTGAAYRRLAEMLGERPVTDILGERFRRSDRFVFVGLNALSESERLLLVRMRNAGVAEFCWDYSSAWIKDAANKSSYFMSRNVADFPQAFEPDAPEALPHTSFNVLGVPSSVGQAKQLPEIFARLGTRGMDTAVVLPDEGLLIPVLNSIPGHISDINVTMGYPMHGSSLWSLMNDLAALQMHLRRKDGKWYFYHRQLWPLLSNSILRSVLDDDASARIASIRAAAGYYVPVDAFGGTGVLSELLSAVVTEPDRADAEQIRRIGDYQCRVLSLVASLIKGRQELSLELDFAKSYYTAVLSLRKFSLEVLPATYFRLLDKLVNSVSVPFVGEPLKGLQIMGPLETRALDFDNVVILGCNEGIFPRRSVSSSFIPAELRRGFGLPTYEYQDAVWAYYFYRLVQRASNVWMLYDSRTEGLQSGEESRYIKQLRMHFGADVTRYTASAETGRGIRPPEIVKTEEDVGLLRGSMLSASALQSYLDCPAKFYYSYVRRLRPGDEVAESLDKGMIGNVFHKTMRCLYDVPGGKVAEPYLASLLHGDRIRDIVDRFILEELNAFEIEGRNIIFEDLICRYARKCVQRDIELLKSSGSEAIRILGLETTRYTSLGGFTFKGIIDRLDSVVPGVVRVVDYKTGKVGDSDFLIDSSNADKVVQALFSRQPGKPRPKIALQLYIYDKMVASDKSLEGSVFVNSIYKPSRLFVRSVETVRLDDTFMSLMDDAVCALLSEIADTSVPFSRTDDDKVCKWCDFKNICCR